MKRKRHGQLSSSIQTMNPNRDKFNRTTWVKVPESDSIRQENTCKRFTFVRMKHSCLSILKSLMIKAIEKLLWSSPVGWTSVKPSPKFDMQLRNLENQHNSLLSSYQLGFIALITLGVTKNHKDATGKCSEGKILEFILDMWNIYQLTTLVRKKLCHNLLFICIVLNRISSVLLPPHSN